MQVNIEDLCTQLSDKAENIHFLDRPMNDVELQANNFVQGFAKEKGLVAHTLGAFRWYFQSDNELVESGLIELRCKINPITHKGHCDFEFVNVGDIDHLKHG